MVAKNVEPLRIETCRAETGCPNALGTFEGIKKIITDVVAETKFYKKREQALAGKIKPHQQFKICLAGCPNCCSQPQIKDFGIYKVVYPQVKHDLCVLCSECVIACKEGAIYIEDSEVKIDPNKCLGCGDCIRACPTEAMQSEKENWKLIAGGKLGRHPGLAVEIAEIDGEEKLAFYLKEALQLVLGLPDPHVRLGEMVDIYLNRIVKNETG